MATKNMDPKAMTLNTLHGFVSLVTVALGLRVLFRLFGAEAGETGFVRWLYETTSALMEPFRNVFTTESFSSKYVLDFAALFAMVAYMVFGLLVMHWASTWKSNK